MRYLTKLWPILYKSLTIFAIIFIMFGLSLLSISIIGDFKFYTGIKEYDSTYTVKNDSGRVDSFSDKVAHYNTMKEFINYIQEELQISEGERESKKNLGNIMQAICSSSIASYSAYHIHQLYYLVFK